MNSNIETKRLIDLLQETPVRIPRIQRDYAQGRLQDNVKKIRRNFVSDLVAVVKGQVKQMNLDFIYGSYQGTGEGRAFEPLDGQQRLTTLYLLHWLLNVPCDYGLTYETRLTSADFFDFLKSLDPREILGQWIDSDSSLKSIITDQEHYRWQWQFDPTIQGVLVTLEEMADQLGKGWLSDPDAAAIDNLSKISFEYLDLKDLGLQKSLYVKMNARGKQLSDFDILKSTLEQDLLRQMASAGSEAEKARLTATQSLWRERIDVSWVDAMWMVYGKDAIKSTLSVEPLSDENRKRRKNIAANVEDYLQRLLLVMISRQLFRSSDPVIAASAYNTEVDKMRSTLDLYMQSHRHEQGDESSVVNIDYQLLADDIDALLSFVTIGNETFPAIMALPKSAYIEYGDSAWHYLDYLTAKKRNNDNTAILHAIIVWLKANAIDKYPADKWIRDFTAWTRFARNILLNNNNYEQIDSMADLRSATDAIDKLVANAFTQTAGEYMSVNQRISQLPAATPGVYVGLVNASVNEEITKAKMKEADDEWAKLIDDAECKPYVWGQIRWLINWSKTDVKEGDLPALMSQGVIKSDFIDYSSRFEALHAYATGQWWQVGLWRTAMLAICNDDFVSTDNRTFMFGYHRDNSFKYYLRYKNNIYGDRLKKFIDLWRTSPQSDDINAFCLSVIENVKTDKAQPLWLRATCMHPELTYEQVWDYFMIQRQGHNCFQRMKTPSSGYNDPVLRHLYKALYDRYKDDVEQGRVEVLYFDSRQETPNRVIVNSLDADGVRTTLYSIYWGDNDNEYILSHDGNTAVLTDDDMLNLDLLNNIGVAVDR